MTLRDILPPLLATGSRRGVCGDRLGLGGGTICPRCFGSLRGGWWSASPDRWAEPGQPCRGVLLMGFVFWLLPGGGLVSKSSLTMKSAMPPYGSRHMNCTPFWCVSLCVTSLTWQLQGACWPFPPGIWDHQGLLCTVRVWGRCCPSPLPLAALPHQAGSS